jgi:hypothetical protein
LAATNEIEQLYARSDKGYYIMSRLLLPRVTGMLARDAEHRARLRTALSALAVERWRAVHGGELPKSLTALVPVYLPAVPHDPYDGQSLRFKRLARGFVVYSIGVDGRDDGGKEKPPKSVPQSPAQPSGFDTTFTVER